MNNKDLPKDFMEILNNVTAKRARFVIDTILRQGYCSTEDLKKVVMNMHQGLQEMFGS